MRLLFLMFVTAVCVLFLLKLRWPKTKSVDKACMGKNILNARWTFDGHPASIYSQARQQATTSFFHKEVLAHPR